MDYRDEDENISSESWRDLDYLFPEIPVMTLWKSTPDSDDLFQVTPCVPVTISNP
jgi:hypothetical protein